MRNSILFLFLILSVSSLFSQSHSCNANKFTDISAHALSPPLRTVAPLPPTQYNENDEEFDHMQRELPLNPVKDKVMVSSKPESRFLNEAVVVINNFEGVHNVNNSPNPDTEGDVGPNHYMQMVKSSFAIWDKEGQLLYGPADNKTIWNSLPGPWHDNNWTDPVVIYDPLADRWIASAMVYDLYVEYWEMIAISATPDPLGAWNCYSLHFTNMPDYPKLGVWTDGYYLTINEYFVSASNNHLEAAGLLVFNREDLMNGNPDPNIIYFRVEGETQFFLTDPASFLPADLDGPLPPPGTPNYLVTIRDDGWGYDFDHIWLWQCVLDWDDTANCVFEELAQLQTEAFDARWDMGSGWVHMPNTTTKLHGLGQFMMYRLQYRNFGDYQTLLCNHTINTGDDHAALRWYELRNYDAEWYIYQSGTFSPDDDSRWMGSIAMDKDGNIGLGYSVSGDETYPSIRLSGRNYNDIPGAITFPEATVASGGGNQANNVRWGDYSMMAVDPTDDLTFWYTQEFLATTGWNTWRTRVASFQLHKNLDSQPDSLVFMTYDECFDGKEVVWKNNSYYPVTINEIEADGDFGGAIWYVDDLIITLPITLLPGDSISFLVKVDFITELINGFLTDTLDLITDYTIHPFTIHLNEDLIVGLEDKKSKSYPPELRIQPNPFKDHTELILELKETGMLEIAVYDLASVKISTIQYAGLKSAGTYRYNLGSGLPAGIYILRVQFNDMSRVMRLVKI